MAQMFQEKENTKMIGNGLRSKLNINTVIDTGGTWHFPALIKFLESSYLVLQWYTYRQNVSRQSVSIITPGIVIRGKMTFHLESEMGTT